MDWRAEVGDEVSIESHRLGASPRRGAIREVLGSPGREYYLVEWGDGHTSVYHPGPDAVLVPRRPRKVRAAQASARAPRPRPAAAATKPEPVVETKARPAVRIAPGDRLIIKGHHLGERDRDAEILEVLGSESAPHYRVRWSDTGREGLLFPGTDAVIEHFPRKRRRAASSKA